MHDDRLKALIEQADANPPACHATPLELAGQVRVLYRRRRRHRASLLAAAAILVAVGLAFWLQIDRGASQSGNWPTLPRHHRRNRSSLAKPPVGLPPAEKRPSRDPSEVTSSPRPPNAYERLDLPPTTRTRGGRQPRSPSKSRKAAGRQGDPVDFAIEQLVIQPDRCTRETAQPLLANRGMVGSRVGGADRPARRPSASGGHPAVGRDCHAAVTRAAAGMQPPCRKCTSRWFAEWHGSMIRRAWGDWHRRSSIRRCGRNYCRCSWHAAIQDRCKSSWIAWKTRTRRPTRLECLALVPDPPVEILFQCLHGPLVVRRMAAARSSDGWTSRWSPAN